MANLSKVLIIGAEGLIGNELDFGIKLSHKDIDVTNRDSIKKALEKHRPEAVLNLASVNLRKAQEDPFLANQVNVIGAYNVALETKQKNIPLIIISTGAVFNGGLDKEFNEEDTPNPLNIYGQTKYLAEIVVKETNFEYLIVRAGWLFGFKSGKNFFNRIMESLNGERIEATYDQFGSFTYIKDFTDKLKEIIEKDYRGIFHIANSGRGNTLELIESLIESFKSKTNIDKVSYNKFNTDIKRSQSEVLVSNIVKLRDWKLALKECINMHVKK